MTQGAYVIPHLPPLPLRGGTKGGEFETHSLDNKGKEREKPAIPPLTHSLPQEER
jgi:hypothetical protein